MGNMHKMEEKQPAVYILNKRNRVNQRCFCENGIHKMDDAGILQFAETDKNIKMETFPKRTCILIDLVV